MEADAWVALKARMDQFSEPGTDIFYVDNVASPAATRPYIFAQFVPTTYETGLIDPACGEDFRGILNLSVCAPVKTWNAAQHLGLAQRVADHFAYGGEYSAGGNTIRVYRRSKVVGSIRLDNAHNRVEVEVAWRIWG